MTVKLKKLDVYLPLLTCHSHQTDLLILHFGRGTGKMNITSGSIMARCDNNVHVFFNLVLIIF